MSAYARLHNQLFFKYGKEKWFEEVLSYLILRYNSIENRMTNTFRYVDCHPLNLKVFSYEYASLLRDTGSVFSSILGELLKATQFPKTSDEYNMGHFRAWLTKEIPEIGKVELVLNYPIRLSVKPFDGISDEKKSLPWWEAYNNVKHSDMSNLKDGNFENTLNSLGALAILYATSDPSDTPEIQLFDEIGFFVRTFSF